MFYFLLVIFFGSFYILNLILAVVALSYQQEMANLKNQVTIFACSLPRIAALTNEGFCVGGREARLHREIFRDGKHSWEDRLKHA